MWSVKRERGRKLHKKKKIKTVVIEPTNCNNSIEKNDWKKIGREKKETINTTTIDDDYDEKG